MTKAQAIAIWSQINDQCHTNMLKFQILKLPSLTEIYIFKKIKPKIIRIPCFQVVVLAVFDGIASR